MRTRINNITFTPGTRSITTGITDLTIDDIRLFINESQMKVICSSMQKDNVVSISSGVVTYKDTFPVLASGDHITFEIDKGDNGAKEANATANKNAIINAINNIDLSTVAKESAATANKEAIIAAINSAEPDLSSVAKETSVKDGNDTTIGMLKDQTNGLAAIKSAIPTVQLVLNGLATSTDLDTVLTRMGQAPIGSSKSTLFAYLSSIWNSMEGQQQEDLPEGLADRIGLLLQFFNIVGSYEAEDIPISTVLSELDTMWENIWGNTPPVNTDNKYITFTVSSVSKTAYRAVIRDVIDAGNAKALCFVDIDNTKYYVYYNGTGGAWDEDSSTLTVGDNVYSDSACTTQVATITGGTSGFVITT